MTSSLVGSEMCIRDRNKKEDEGNDSPDSTQHGKWEDDVGCKKAVCQADCKTHPHVVDANFVAVPQHQCTNELVHSIDVGPLCVPPFHPAATERPCQH
eukprot:12920626-Prorocentrum_lima.AAC.1